MLNGKKYQERDIQNLFDSGSVKSATTYYFPLDQGWHVWFTISGHPASQLVYTQRGDIRTFKTLDAVERFISKIGLQSFVVSPQRT